MSLPLVLLSVKSLLKHIFIFFDYQALKQHRHEEGHKDFDQAIHGDCRSNQRKKEAFDLSSI